MILQQLCKDADRLVGDLPPPMYDVKPVRWVVYLNADGTAQWPPQATSGGEGKKDRGKPRLVPFKGRAYAVQPLLLADKVTYTWGQPADHKRAAQEHAAYLDLLDRCAARTENADVALIARFLREWDPERQSLPKEMLPDQLTTFAVDERFPIDDPAVRGFWAAEVGGDEGSGTPGQCLVCGLETQLVDRLPVPLKGIPNGQASGVHLVSANASAFESYGRAAALTSSICQSCGERFGKAANALLSGEKTHLRVGPNGPAVYLFWAPEGGGDWVVDFIQAPKPEEVRELLRSGMVGKLVDTVDDQPFYAASLTAAISRAVVRSWLNTTVGTARTHIRRWFQWQRIVYLDGTEGQPLSVFRLAASLYRDATKELVARTSDALIQTTLHGTPLPMQFLALAVRRCQVEGQVTYARAALIKTVFRSQLSAEEALQKGEDWMCQLDMNESRPAYHWGRMLAVLEAIQRSALESPGRKLNSTIVDRVYGAASTAPGIVFGRLMAGTQGHLKKLAGPLAKGGVAENYRKRLEGISLKLPPDAVSTRPLCLPDQALFALGYYHERACMRAQRVAGSNTETSPEGEGEENENE
jgi:CRISPR-associated protein Csd1